MADKPDSHDVCFIADGDTRKFLEGRLGALPGRIVDTEGAVVGSHDGSYGFTVGQRKGLRIGTPAPDGRPRYVLDIEPVSNTVTVGPAEALGVDRHRGGSGRSGAAACRPAAPVDCLVQLRAHGEQHRASAWLDGGTLRISLNSRPRRGQGPGRRPVRRRRRPRQRHDHRNPSGSNDPLTGTRPATWAGLAGR